jgi:cysteinyl-tRNA synthetase
VRAGRREEEDCMPARLVVALALIVISAAPVLGDPQSSVHNPLLKVDSWGYQLQAIDTKAFAKLNYDLVVMDYSKAGDKGSVFTSAELDQIRKMPNGRKRILLAYLSVGEAETYRYYWQPGWSSKRPSWIGRENRSWSGNFTVEYWNQEWRKIIFEGPDSYLKRIIDAGFDGVYLDRVDIYAELERQNANAREDMISFVRALSAKARSIRKDFLVVVQNAEELAQSNQLLEAIDGVAKEDLLFGADHNGKRNPEAMIRQSVVDLKRARDFNKGVFVVEYLRSPEQLMGVLNELARRDGRFVPHFADRPLSQIRAERFEDLAHEED